MLFNIQHLSLVIKSLRFQKTPKNRSISILEKQEHLKNVNYYYLARDYVGNNPIQSNQIANLYKLSINSILTKFN